MKNINLYENTAAYAADANRPINQSAVSHILDGAGIKCDGKNVLVDKASASVGDILVFDKTTSLRKFIRVETFHSASLPVSIVTIGVVYYRQSDRVFIAAKNNEASVRFAQGFKVKLSGFNYQAGDEFFIQINGLNHPDSIVFSDEDNINSLAGKVNAALNSGADDTAFKHWTVTVIDDYMVAEHNRHTPVINSMAVLDYQMNPHPEDFLEVLTPVDYQTVLSGLFSNVYANISRNDGTAAYYAGMNYEKFYQYYYVNGASTINQTLGAVDLIKFAVYNSVDNAALVSYYGPGESGYAKYLQDKMTRHPYGKNAIVDDNGQLNTSLLSAVTFVDANGIVKPAYPAAYNAQNSNIGAVPGYVTGLEPGAWWLPSVREMNFLIKDRRLDLLDRVNLSLSAIGGVAINPSLSYWTSSERSSNNAWGYSGSVGLMGNYNKSSSSSVRPVTAF